MSRNLMDRVAKCWMIVVSQIMDIDTYDIDICNFIGRSVYIAIYTNIHVMH